MEREGRFWGKRLFVRRWKGKLVVVLIVSSRGRQLAVVVVVVVIDVVVSVELCSSF